VEQSACGIVKFFLPSGRCSVTHIIYPVLQSSFHICLQIIDLSAYITGRAENPGLRLIRAEMSAGRTTAYDLATRKYGRRRLNKVFSEISCEKVHHMMVL
jgi:hypothetical protein